MQPEQPKVMPNLDQIIQEEFVKDFPVDERFKVGDTEYSGLKEALAASWDMVQSDPEAINGHVMIESQDSHFGAFSAHNIFEFKEEK